MPTSITSRRAATELTVKVAIDLALDRLFTYTVPDELQKKLAVGQLLSVPFGHREARGFAMEIGSLGSVGTSGALGSAADGTLPGLSEPSSESSVSRTHSLKPVTTIVDEVPFFSQELLALVRQIADYTASPIESVLHAAVPAVVLKPSARPKEQLFVEPATGSQQSATGNQLPTTISRIPNSQSPTPNSPALTKHQQWLYEQILRLGGGWLQQLARELKTTPATIRALAARGLVTVAPRQRRRDPLGRRRVLPTKPLPLNGEQQAALARILVSNQPILLHGITGSGKTEVYLQAIAAELEKGRGAIVMVPEIALTPQTVQRFASRFGDRVAVLHSALSDGERYDEWHRIRGGEARVVVGPRSAVFAPVPNLGLIVVDEEHETSYKQEDNPRYNARDVAVMRGRLEGAKVVLGSATPSLESWINVEKGKYAFAEMKSRAGAGTLPFVTIVDMNEEKTRGAIFSDRLLDAIKTRLGRHEQTILFLNRRGYSRSVTCGACGYVIECPDCSVAYTYHQADDCCRCHICGGWIPTPKECPCCHAPALAYRGIGTQRAEAALAKCFREARILRMDADSTSRKYSHDDILGAFRRHEADVLLGTQMIAKGLDFPNVTLVGVLNADSSLNMPDFRAAERTYQLLSQVAGRAGRAELPGEVFIQTYDPESTTIRAAAKGDFAAFAAAELAIRKEFAYPPYCHFSLVTLKSKDLKLVSNWSVMYAESLRKVKGLEVGEAIPSVLEKAEGWYRWQIAVKSASAALTVRAWRWIVSARPAPKELRIALDVDAFNLI